MIQCNCGVASPDIDVHQMHVIARGHTVVCSACLDDIDLRLYRARFLYRRNHATITTIFCATCWEIYADRWSEDAT